MKHSHKAKSTRFCRANILRPYIIEDGVSSRPLIKHPGFMQSFMRLNLSLYHCFLSLSRMDVSVDILEQMKTSDLASCRGFFTSPAPLKALANKQTRQTQPLRCLPHYTERYWQLKRSLWNLSRCSLDPSRQVKWKARYLRTLCFTQISFNSIYVRACGKNIGLCFAGVPWEWVCGCMCVCEHEYLIPEE